MYMQTSRKRKTTGTEVSKKAKIPFEGNCAQVEQSINDESVSCATSRSLKAMETARNEVERLVRIRADHKLSNSRANSVAKELKELIKVLSLYNY